MKIGVELLGELLRRVDGVKKRERILGRRAAALEPILNRIIELELPDIDAHPPASVGGLLLVGEFLIFRLR